MRATTDVEFLLGRRLTEESGPWRRGGISWSSATDEIGAPVSL